MGYTALTCWFAYGLFKTRQKGFVGIIALLFIGSQWTFYNGMYDIDRWLTLSCFLIMCVKQYLWRHGFAQRETIYSEHKKEAA
jgi:hypothetical protein